MVRAGASGLNSSPMPGYTEEQLEAKRANLANYVGCLNCRLHWYKKSFERHFNVVPTTRGRKARPIAIIHPAWERFYDFLVTTAIKHTVDERAEKVRAGEPIETRIAGRETAEERKTADDCETITVDEAVSRFGLSRQEILADFERNMVPFEVTLPAPKRKGRSVSS